ncbi:MAG: mannan-binding protein, partial [Mycobacterium sp.]
MSLLLGAAAAVLTVAVTAPAAAASAVSFCDELGGQWNGQSCQTSVRSERNAVRDITVAIPSELVDDAVAGPVVREYLRTLVENWKRVGVH